ncbi:MAG: V4R domain-containing protein [Thermoproteota archaeon]
MARTTENEYKPIDLSRMILDPENRIYFISLTLVNKSGALASFLNILKKHGFNLVGILSESISKKEEIEVSMFLETPTKMNLADLEKLIEKEIDMEKIDVVKKIKIFDHSGWFDEDSFHFPLQVGKVRAVIFPIPVLEGFLVGLRKSLGDEIVQTIVWYQGREIGKNTLETYRKEYGVEGISAVEILKKRALILGWAKMEIVHLDEKEKKAVIKIFDNWECDMFKEKSAPQSHFIRGILSGFFSSLFREDLKGEETRCIAKGDPYCEFILSANKNVKEPRKSNDSLAFEESSKGRWFNQYE